MKNKYSKLLFAALVLIGLAVVALQGDRWFSGLPGDTAGEIGGEEPPAEGNSHEEHGSHEGHDDHGEEIVSLSPEEIAEFGLKIGTAGPGILSTRVDLPGEIRINQDRLAHIVPRVKGVVRGVLKNVGDPVRKNEPMAVFESVELGETKIEYFQRKKQLAIALTDLERTQTIHDNTLILLELLKASADSETVLNKTRGMNMGENRSRLITAFTHFLLTREILRREKDLYQKKISSRADFLKAESDFKDAQADYLTVLDEVSFGIKRQLIEQQNAFDLAQTAMLAAERHLLVLGVPESELHDLEKTIEPGTRIAKFEIQSPIAGTVIEKHITLGEVLKKDAKAFVVADLSTVWVDLDIYQKDLPLVREGMKVLISIGYGIPGVTGKISYLRSLVGEKTRTALARIVLPNPKAILRPGLFVTGKVNVANVSVPVRVPKTALQTMEGKTAVFIQTDAGFRPQPVVTGIMDDTYAEIVSGLAAGQRYVSQKGFALKAQLSKGGFEAGHSH